MSGLPFFRVERESVLGLICFFAVTPFFRSSTGLFCDSTGFFLSPPLFLFLGATVALGRLADIVFFLCLGAELFVFGATGFFLALAFAEEEVLERFFRLAKMRFQSGLDKLPITLLTLAQHHATIALRSLAMVQRKAPRLLPYPSGDSESRGIRLSSTGNL